MGKGNICDSFEKLHTDSVLFNPFIFYNRYRCLRR